MARDYEIYPGFYRNTSVNATIEEKRAPTDESVRLLKELEKEARNKVIAIIQNESNGCNFSAHVFYDNLSFNATARIRVSINEKSLEYDRTIPNGIGKTQLAQFIVDDLGREIARQLIVQNFDQIKQLFPSY